MVTVSIWRRRSPSGVGTIAEVVCIILTGAAVALFSATTFLVEALGANWATYLGSCGAAPAFALLIFVFASQGGAISKLLTHPLAVLLGEISFSMYLLHQLMIHWLVTHRSAWSGLGESTVYCLYWVALLFVSWTVWRFVETPARLAIMRFAPTR